jgi:Asp-tRNA(Asn)/Glu-tRNA(Gln) amidotransferase A subunit family amidase
VRPTREPLQQLSVIGVGILLACSSPEPIDVVETTIGAVQDAIRSGRTTCRMVVESYLERIDAYDKPTGMNAITVVNPNALARADEIDAAVESGGPLGPLFCAPLLIKDNYDTHDLPTTGGSIALANSLPPDDAFMVRKLREGDAIVLAKTNMAEWAFSPRQTVSSSFGTTANAYAMDRVPAGSSGGTASGVAANLGVAGMGTDTGNSIRGPSSHLALFGIRSTIGLTSRDGVIPLAFDRDIAGPMTRTVEDGARIFNVVAGYDPADPYTEAGRGRKADDYTAFLDPAGLQGARIGVLRALVDTDDADSAVTAVFEQAVRDLQRLGAEVVDPFEVPTLEEHFDARNFCQRFRYDMWVYLGSLGERAPIRDVMEAYEAGQYSEYIESRLEANGRRPADVAPKDWDPPCPDYSEHEGRQRFLRDVVAAMDNATVDAIVYPTWTNPPAHLDNAREEYKGDNSQLVAPATGMPAVTVPMGFSYDNLPAGLQILARPYDEGLLFKFAYAYEQGTHHRRPPAGFPALATGTAEVAEGS